MDMEWNDICDGKNKLNKDNPIIPSAHYMSQASGDKEFILRETGSPIESVSALTEDQNISYVETYHQKLPISFISPKDWQKYLHFTTELSDNFDHKDNLENCRGKSGRIVRLLNSFHRLYQEYSSVCSKYAPCSQNVKSDNSKTNQWLIKPKQIHYVNNQCGDQADSFDSNEENLVEVGVQTVVTMNTSNLISDLINYENKCHLNNGSPVPTKSFISWNWKYIFKPAQKLTRRLKQLKQISSKSHEPIIDKCYDKIIKNDTNINMDIIEDIVKQKNLICHKILLSNDDRNKFNLEKFTDIQIPLALELLLPKIQIKIENILNECPYLCDPLEIAAELRQFDYDQIQCISYFNDTKFLRSIIEDMMSPNTNQQSQLGQITNIINNSANIVEEIRSNGSGSVLSTHSPGINNKNELELGNDLTNCSNANNHSSKQPTGLSVDRIFHAVKELCTFSEKNHTITSNSKSSTLNSAINYLDSITQTSMVHFYMDDKNLEAFFHKMRQYVTIIRQIQTEIREEVEYLNKQLICVFTSLKCQFSLLINQNSDKITSNHEQSKLLTLSKQVEELKLKLKKEEKRRRHVYNMMQEQLGNIRVYCRCRIIGDGVSILELIGNETIGIPSASNEKFEFDKVFHPTMSQIDVYDEFRPLVMSFIDGYNVCFITYGGEASGKTYTLIGGSDGPNQQGLMQRALTTILMEEKLRQRDWEYKITACVVEIYNDNCIDVLSGETNIQLYVDNGMEPAYQKLKSVPINNEADAEALMQVCRVRRKVAKTALNPASSRSHLITLIRLQGKSRIHGESICSFLCLCDLAGFEDIIKAETQTNKVLSKEAGYINRSLTAFNRLFVSLRKQDPNTVSYRDTKLTHLLKPFLTNSGKCALIVTVRSDKRSLGSTQNTLRFGRETRGVTLGRARRQVNMNI